jgi:hypothetical protein
VNTSTVPPIKAAAARRSWWMEIISSSDPTRRVRFPS